MRERVVTNRATQHISRSAQRPFICHFGARKAWLSQCRQKPAPHSAVTTILLLCEARECEAGYVRACVRVYACVRVRVRARALSLTARGEARRSLLCPRRRHVQCVYDAIAHQWHGTRCSTLASIRLHPRIISLHTALSLHNLGLDEIEPEDHLVAYGPFIAYTLAPIRLSLMP